jgi:hypothetical protein
MLMLKLTGSSGPQGPQALSQERSTCSASYICGKRIEKRSLWSACGGVPKGRRHRFGSLTADGRAKRKTLTSCDARSRAKAAMAPRLRRV